MLIVRESDLPDCAWPRVKLRYAVDDQDELVIGDDGGV
jgi:hypothetical protein